MSISTNADFAGTEALRTYLTDNFAGITAFNVGNYADPTTIPAGTDVAIIGRFISSNNYSDVTRAQGWNALTIPVISFTSFASRDNGSRLAWHSGSSADAGAGSANGADSTLTAAGASLFGGAAGDTLDIYDETHRTGGSISTLGIGIVGDGDILATVGGNIVAAQWDTGDAFGGTVTGTTPDTAGGPRLLFNLSEPNIDPDVNVNRAAANDPGASLSAAGQDAFNAAVVATAPALAVPEPSTGLLGLCGLVSALGFRRRP